MILGSRGDRSTNHIITMTVLLQYFVWIDMTQNVDTYSDYLLC